MAPTVGGAAVTPAGQADDQAAFRVLVLPRPSLIL
jgi:hypothetical protein